MNILVYVHSLRSGDGAVSFRSSALDGAMQMAEQCPDIHITAVAMDQPGGEASIRASLALAAEDSFLLRPSGGEPHDSVALGRLLAEAVLARGRSGGPVDAVFCGDADPGQDGLGPALAGHLGWPQVTGANCAEVTGNSLLVWRSWDDVRTLLRVELPCVLSFLPAAVPAGYPLLSRLTAANQAEIPRCGASATPSLQRLLAFSPRPRQGRSAFRATQEDMDLLARFLVEERMAGY